VNAAPRRLTLGLVLACGLAVAVAGCGGGESPSSSPTPGRTATGTATLNPDIPPSPVAGVVINIQSEGLDRVRGFTLRTRSGVEVNFTIGKLDDPTDFPPGHLAEHQASAAPVLVWFTVAGSTLLVYHLEDAP
jgi:hypothetical protein